MSKRDGSRVDSATIGAWGEHLAAAWLRRNGRKVLYHNFRAPHGGEVDIICRHGEILTFVEVKARTDTRLGRPGAAVTSSKEKLIMRGARAWLKALGDPTNTPTRCDVVEVVLREGHKAEISVIEGAFRVK